MLVTKVSVLFWVCMVSCGGFLLPSLSLAEDYSFNLDEFEKKAYSLGGYAEVKGEHCWINRSGAFGLLGFYDSPRSNLDRLTTTIQLDGNLNQGIVDFNWLLQAFTQNDQHESNHELNVFSAYASIKPAPSVTFEIGKKTFKWGKGYAWNPVGFINRPKDPNNPEEALEGYIGAGADLIKSFSGALQTIALTSVLLPVWEDVNEAFGEKNNLNFAAKLYLLYRDTDIDFILFTGNSRSTRFGIDLSKNLATNFEIHAELAYIPAQKSKVLNSLGRLTTREESVTSYLLGLRYLTETDITAVIEYYHNDAGYSANELDQFYQLVTDAHSSYRNTGDDSLLRQATTISKSGYARPQAGRNYLYAKITQKEPFELLYFTPGMTTIINLDDASYSLSPEAVYTGFTNWELRLRYSHLDGGRFTEQGEKLNEEKLELRLRYYF